MHKVTVMTKPDCRACEAAMETVQRVVGSHVPALIEEVDITQDVELLAKYRDAVPVVIIDGVEHFRNTVDPDKLARVFYDAIQQRLLGF
jgi:hypothetical protein